MPFKSKQQARWMHANHPEMARRWADHTDDSKALPDRVEKAAELGPYDRTMASTVSGLDPMIASMASNRHEHPGHYLLNPFVPGPLSEMSARVARRAAASMGSHTGHAAVGEATGPLLPAVFGGADKKTKLREALPDVIAPYDEAGADKDAAKKMQTKEGHVMNTVAQMAKTAAELPYAEKLAADSGLTADHVFALAKLAGMPTVTFCKHAYNDPKSFNGLLGLVKRAGTPGAPGKISDLIAKARGLSARHPAATTAGALGAPLALGGTIGLMNSGGPKPELPVPPTAGLPGPDTGPSAGGSVGGGFGGPASPMDPGSNSVSSPAAGGVGGMSPLAKGLLAGGAGLAGAYGLSKLVGRRRKKEAAYVGPVAKLIAKTVREKAAAFRVKQAREVMCLYLDRVAMRLPLEKAAAVRTVQANVAGGKSLSTAIKVAYPHLNGERRGVVAERLCRGAELAMKQANAGCGMPVQTPQSATVPMSQSATAMNKMAMEPPPGAGGPMAASKGGMGTGQLMGGAMGGLGGGLASGLLGMARNRAAGNAASSMGRAGVPGSFRPRPAGGGKMGLLSMIPGLLAGGAAGSMAGGALDSTMAAPANKLTNALGGQR